MVRVWGVQVRLAMEERRKKRKKKKKKIYSMLHGRALHKLSHLILILQVRTLRLRKTHSHSPESPN